MAKALTAAEALAQLAGGLTRTARTRNIHRWRPLPHQELFLQSQVKNRILLGGNRAGKTETGVADDVHVARRTHPYRNHLYPPAGFPVRMRCIGVDYDRGIKQIFLPKWQQLLPPSALINGSWEDSYSRGDRILTLEDGTTISFMSYEQDADKFQGVSLHHQHLDEEPPKPIYDESVLRALDVRGTMTISETPVQQLEWLEDEVIVPAEEGTDPDWQVIRLSTLDNTYLPTDELQKLVGKLSPEAAKIRLQGEYTGGTLVFPRFRRAEPYVIPHASFRLTPDWAIYEGMDWGYTHPGAWEWIAIHPTGRAVSFAEVHAAQLVPEQWAIRVKEKRQALRAEYGLAPAVWDRMFRGTIGDPAIGQVNGQTGITLQQAFSLLGIGIATEGIVKARSEQGQNFGLTRMRSYQVLQADGLPTWQLTDGVPGLADELRRARRPKQSLAVAENKAAPEGIRDKDNDTIDAVKYVFMVAHDLRPHDLDDQGANERVAAEQLHELMRARGAVQNPLTVEDVRAAQVASQWRTFGSASSLEG